MRVLLELVRIGLFILIVGWLGSYLLFYVYGHDSVAMNYRAFGLVALFINIFVLYRNRLQFSGWTQREDPKPLSKRWTRILLFMSFLFFLMPFIISYLNR